MRTEFCAVDFHDPRAMTERDQKIIARAGEILRSGGLVAFPTETVYGLGGNALDPQAAAKIYAAKGRPSDNPLIIHIADVEALDALAIDIPDAAWKLAGAFWPGPLTMVLKKKPDVPRQTTGGLDTAAIRFPSHPVARAVISASGTYIAAPSANTSGRPSPTTAAHVLEDMDGRIDMIVDGGRVDIGLESTIVDLTGETPVILRPGYISQAMLEKILGEVRIDPAVSGDMREGIAPRAPGMKYRHYAPRGALTIVEGAEAAVVKKINNLAAQAASAGKKTAVIAAEETKALYRADVVVSAGDREHDETIAANLYEILRQMDAVGADVIYSESFEGGALGQAIMNRLLKAAGHRVIRAQ